MEVVPASTVREPRIDPVPVVVDAGVPVSQGETPDGVAESCTGGKPDSRRHVVGDLARRRLRRRRRNDQHGERQQRSSPVLHPINPPSRSWKRLVTRKLTAINVPTIHRKAPIRGVIRSETAPGTRNLPATEPETCLDRKTGVPTGAKRHAQIGDPKPAPNGSVYSTERLCVRLLRQWANRIADTSFYSARTADLPGRSTAPVRLGSGPPCQLRTEGQPCFMPWRRAGVNPRPRPLGPSGPSPTAVRRDRCDFPQPLRPR